MSQGRRTFVAQTSTISHHTPELIKLFFVMSFLVAISFLSTRTRAQNFTAQVQGSFFPAHAQVTEVPFPPGPNIAAADLNNDGTPDFVGLNGGFPFGGNSGTFRVGMLNENGSIQTWSQSASAVNPPTLQGYRAILTEDFNNDGLQDVVTLSHRMILSTMLNEGQNQTTTGFPNSLSIDLYATVGWVFTNQMTDPVPFVPVFESDDYDHDGNKDVLIAFNIVNYWSQNFSTPGILILWGRGDGTFEGPQVVPVSQGFGAVDLSYVDWNADGQKDTLLYLEQNLNLGQYYNTQLMPLRFQGALNRQVVPVLSTPLGLGDLILNSLEYIAPYSTPYGPSPHILAMSGHRFPTPWQMEPKAYVVGLDDQFQMVNSIHSLSLPVGSPSVNSELQGLKAVDMNLDGHLDLVAVHQKKYISGQALPHSEIVFIEGPISETATFAGSGFLELAGVASLAVNTPTRSAPNSLNLFYPNRMLSDLIRIVDFNSDQVPDLMLGAHVVPGPGFSVNQGVTPVALTIMNYTNFGVTGRSRVERVSTVGNTWSPLQNVKARCGVSGGRPQIGNSSFEVNLSDAPSQGIAALVGGYQLAPWTHPLGLNMAFIPESYSNLYTLQQLGQSTQGRQISQNIPIPNDPSLVGTSVSFQWVMADTRPSSAPGSRLGCSDAVTVTVGD